MRLSSFLIAIIALSGCNPSIVVVPNGTVLRITDTRPVEVATWDAKSKTWIVRGRAVITGYYADPPIATTQP